MKGINSTLVTQVTQDIAVLFRNLSIAMVFEGNLHHDRIDHLI